MKQAFIGLMLALAAWGAEISSPRKDYSQLVYPWSHGTTWGEVHIPWRYEMDIEVMSPLDQRNQKGSLQRIKVRVDGIKERARQDVYVRKTKE